MGEAKRRGTLEERQQQGIEKAIARQKKQLREIAEAEARMSPVAKARRAQTRSVLLLASALAESSKRVLNRGY